MISTTITKLLRLLEMDKLSKLLEETQNLLEGFSSGSLSPVSSYYNSDEEGEVEESDSEVGDFNLLLEFKKLLKEGENSRIQKFIESWDQPLPKGALHLAVEENCKDLEVFKTLLRVGCDPLELNSSSKTALTILLEQKEEDDDNCLISTLLGEWELRRAATRDSKIFKFVHERNWKDFYSFLLKTADDPIKLLCKPDAKFAGISPLHEITALNDVPTLKKLLKKFKNIDFNVKAIGSGNTPLHEATHMSAGEMVSFLLDNGARCDVKNAAGKIPAHLGTEKIQVIIEIKNMTQSQEEIGRTSSMDSISREERKLKQIIGFLDQIERHSEGDGASESFGETRAESNSADHIAGHDTVNSENHTDTPSLDAILQRESHSGRTILHRFARRNQSQKLVNFLKENDFTESKCKELKLFEVIDNSGYTPLHEAASEGSLETAKIFLFGNKAAKIKNLLINPSIPAAITGDTPLHAAASSGNDEIVELLLEVGADKEAENIEGKRAVDVTRSKSVKRLLVPYEEVSVKPGKSVMVVAVNNNTSETIKTADFNVEMPVKRGPGRPRKYPRPDDPHPPQQQPPVKITKLSSSPPQPSITNLSFTDLDGNRDACFILVKLRDEWLMLYDQFQQIISHLKSQDDSYSQDVLEMSPADGLAISKLPKLGPLIESLRSRHSTDSLRFISKTRALQILEKDFQTHLIGPFGYIDLVRLKRQTEQVYSGCPLKLKMKQLQKEIKHATNWLNTQFCIGEEQKSPKSFQM